MRRRVSRRAVARVVMAFVVVIGVGVGTPRPVEATTTGVGALEGTVLLPYFPCASCNPGTLTATSALSLSGLGTASISGVPAPYTAVWPATLNNFSAQFQYSDSCVGVPNGVPSIDGNGGGGFTLTGGLLVLGGGTLTNATLSGSFNFRRLGSGFAVALSSLTVTAASTGAPVAVNLNNGVTGQSPMAFVWTNGPGTCGPGQLVNQTAQVVGLTLQAA